MSRGAGFPAGLQSSPQNEVLPEHQPAEGGKTRHVQPFTRGRVRHSGEDGELFRIQRLIESLLLLQRSEADSTQLFVMAHWSSRDSFRTDLSEKSLSRFKSDSAAPAAPPGRTLPRTLAASSQGGEQGRK